MTQKPKIIQRFVSKVMGEIRPLAINMINFKPFSTLAVFTLPSTFYNSVVFSSSTLSDSSIFPLLFYRFTAFTGLYPCYSENFENSSMIDTACISYLPNRLTGLVKKFYLCRVLIHNYGKFSLSLALFRAGSSRSQSIFRDIKGTFAYNTVNESPIFSHTNNIVQG